MIVVGLVEASYIPTDWEKRWMPKHLVSLGGW